MAKTMAESERSIDAFQRLGFFVVAPIKQKRGSADTNLEICATAESIRTTVRNRIAMYESVQRPEAARLRTWEQAFVLPLVERLEKVGTLAVLSWEECIDAITSCNRQIGTELSEFYQRCLS